MMTSFFAQITSHKKLNKMAGVNSEFLAIIGERLRFYISFGYILQCNH